VTGLIDLRRTHARCALSPTASRRQMPRSRTLSTPHFELSPRVVVWDIAARFIVAAAGHFVSLIKHSLMLHLIVWTGIRSMSLMILHIGSAGESVNGFPAHRINIALRSR
jgi:hypothetical protein